MKKTQFERMTESPIPQLTLRLAVPGVMGMLISTLYNTVDTWFVAQLGTLAVGACGVSYSIMEGISSMGYLFGMGGGTLIGLSLGAKKKKEANVIGSTAFFTTLFLGALAAVLGLIFIEPLMRLLGSSEGILPYAVDYSRCILLGFPVMSGSLVLSTILRCEGENHLAAIGIVSGALLNMLLDPVFIFVLKLGIGGASLATLLSQSAGLAVLLFFYLTGRSETKLSIRSVRLEPRLTLRILSTGLPSLCRHLVMTFSNIAMNTAAGLYGGDLMIAALSIVTKVSSLLQSVLKGVFQGMQTIFSYNKGAKRYDRVRSAYRFALLFNMALIVLFNLIVLRKAGAIISLFRAEDAAVVAIGAQALVLTCLSLLFMPFNLSANMLLQSTGEPIRSTILAALPQCVFYIPLLFALPPLMGEQGVLVAPILSYALTFAVSLPVVLSFFARMRALERSGG